MADLRKADARPPKGSAARQRQSATHSSLSNLSSMMSKTTTQGIDYGLLPDLLGYHLRLAQIATFGDFAEAVGEYQVSPSLFGVLVIIAKNPGLKQAELARAVHLDRSTMVSVIDKLEKRKLVQRKPAPGDRRSNAIQLTDAGLALLDTLIPLVDQHERRLTEHLSQDEQSTLRELLGKLFPERRNQ